MAGQHIGLGADCRRMYDVRRFDDECRQLAVLTVSDARLEWWELGAGGVLELAPACLLFVPRRAAISAHRITRCLLQRRSRLVESDGRLPSAPLNASPAPREPAWPGAQPTAPDPIR